MANMSYCRFQNTLKDLRDCKNAMDEMGSLEDAKEELSSEEYSAMVNIIGLAAEITDEFSLEDDE